MKTEYEVKVLDSDFTAIRAKLAEAGGKLLQPRRMMKRYILDYEAADLQKSNAYIRVRDEGDRVTTTYKLTESRSVDGVKELEVEVSELETMIEIYKNLGLVVHSYQETFRESWEVDGVEVELDEWPWLDPFIEIEGHSEQEVRSLVEKLGYQWQDAVPGDVVQLYQDIYDIEDWEISRKNKIEFGPVPKWLEERRKK